MDGLKGVIPNSCKEENSTTTDIFGEKTISKSRCLGCINNDIKKHNGIYCVIKDWSVNVKKGRETAFVELIKS